jgi:hypothetical protein
MTGTGVGTKRALALRQLAARSGERGAGEAAGRVSALHSGAWSHVGLATELLFGWIVAVLAATMIVGFTASVAPADVPASTRTIVVPEGASDVGEDLDPRDPLVMCTVFATHTKCAREES